MFRVSKRTTDFRDFEIFDKTDITDDRVKRVHYASMRGDLWREHGTSDKLKKNWVELKILQIVFVWSAATNISPIYWTLVNFFPNEILEYIVK